MDEGIDLNGTSSDSMSETTQDSNLNFNEDSGENLLLNWQLKRYQKWLFEPSFESFRRCLFIKKRPKIILTVIDKFCSLEFLKSKKGRNLVPYWFLAMLENGNDVKVVRFLKIFNWAEIFESDRENLTSFFIRVYYTMKGRYDKEKLMTVVQFFDTYRVFILFFIQKIFFFIKMDLRNHE